MIIVFILVLILSVLLLFSFVIILNRFEMLELIVFYLFTSFLCQHINFKLFSAYERLSVAKGIIPKIISFLHFGLILPILLIWVFYVYRSKNPLIYSLLFSLIWVGFDLFSKQLFLMTNILESKTTSWYPVIDIIVSIFVLLVSFKFMIKFISILKKERVAIE
ncbi:hypothetical protein SAMN04488577_4000 [Bacillus sp. cl95]|nr:hypothetical protein SAMN02799634_10920 [Bacillus sp. UNCCL13]SFQ91027.1 hypothetical protein SAMN04488577_4000 [Bacillus sp. cl95]